MTTAEMIASERRAMKSSTYRGLSSLGIYPLLKLPMLIEMEANRKLDRLQREIHKAV